MKTSWDIIKCKMVNTPKKLEYFFNDIEGVYIKHNLSISHEDGHGAFEIERYNKFNVKWLRDAHINLKKKRRTKLK